MNSTPLVSVITASYNMAHYLPEAIDSVLSQDYPNIEIIVVNDGSTDNTREVLAAYEDDDRVTAIHQENKGQTVAKNQGFAAAKGELIAFCDADNRWLAGKLSTQVPMLLDNPAIGVVYGDIILIDGQGNRKPPAETKRHSGKITAQLLVDNFVTFNTTLLTHKLMTQMNGFDESLRMAIDYDLWLRISLKHDFLFMPEPMVEYRIWEGQMSNRTGDRMDNFFKLLEKFVREHPDDISDAQARHAWAHSYTTKANWLSGCGRKSEAWQDYQRALKQRPNDLRLWKSMVKSVLNKFPS